MRVSLGQVSSDDGANIYFYNNRTQENIRSGQGYWFGISGALDAIVWGEIIGGSLMLSDIVVSETPLGQTQTVASRSSYLDGRDARTL